MLKSQEGCTLPASTFLKEDADDGPGEKLCHSLEKLGNITR